MRIKFNVAVDFTGTNGKPEVGEFYVIEHDLEWEKVLRAVADAIEGSSHVITRVAITPGKPVL